MVLAELLSSPALPRALVLGVFGGAGLVLTMIYSRRGPLIYPVYAALLAALALLLARYPSEPFGARFAAAFGGFLVATAMAYVAVSIRGGQEAQRLRREGRQMAQGGVTPLGHLWRLGLVLGIGAAVSAGVAFVAA
jgi:drug/metabolite transporter superfamily protein YnfA